VGIPLPPNGGSVGKLIGKDSVGIPPPPSGGSVGELSGEV
jgi:hypothetical protein